MSTKTVDLTPDSSAHRDARCYPRYRAQLPAELVTPTGEQLAVTTRIISMVGLELNCAQLATLQVLAKDRDKPAAQRRILSFSIELPSQPPHRVNGTASLVNSRRVAQDRYVLAIQYLNLSSEDRDQLAEFLDNCSLA